MSTIRLLLISRGDILGVLEDTNADKALRLLSSLTRQGYHLLVTAPQPEKWTGEHGSPDDALFGPNGIRKRLADAGGILDGVYYVRRSMLTQQRHRVDALEDILQRYATKPEYCTLLSSKRQFVKAARHLLFNAVWLGHDHDLVQELSNLNEHGAAES